MKAKITLTSSVSQDEDKIMERINRLMDLTSAEEGRSLVLSMTAFAEELLGRLLLTYLRNCKSSNELIEGFNAPLGTFSSRIKACHAFGIISNKQHHDLEITRKIRNEFAHNWEGCSFTKQKIYDLATSMNNSRLCDNQPTEPKEKFCEVMYCILLELSYLQTKLDKDRKMAPFVGLHLSLNPHNSVS